jgi:ATP synthase F1 delta subunit
VYIGTERQAPQVYGQTGKYAQALFNTAKKRGGNTLNQLINDLDRFIKAYNSNQSIQQALDNPVLSSEKKAQLIKKLAPQLKISELSAEFISVIASKGHISLLKDIQQDYERLVAYERNEIRAVVTSADPLTDTQRKNIIDALKKRIGANQSLQVTEKVDPKILGGLVVSIDDKSVDLSVATQIRKIESALRRQ